MATVNFCSWAFRYLSGFWAMSLPDNIETLTSHTPSFKRVEGAGSKDNLKQVVWDNPPP